ncbi:MAG: selenium-dependent molybdenum cofactor biosynthesis protein YqeB [Chloroflexota bacterium]|nr:selenium-dependent molybdenum cofactor biosynthesis protein YqeB [Chloroflexota bacterium]
MHPFANRLIMVRGGGDLGSGVAYRLARVGFPVVIAELECPTFVRRMVCFGEAVYSGSITIEGVTARLDPHAQPLSLIERGIGTPHEASLQTIAVMIDPKGEALSRLRPTVVIDARMEKRNPGTTLDDAPLVIALGPGYTAGVDCHAVVETNRGHDLGRVLWQGSAEPDTGEPGVMGGHTHSRVLRAPAAGQVQAHYAIGDHVEQGAVIAEVGGQPVVAAFAGVLRGIIHPRVLVTPGMKIGDLDPRAQRRHCFTISDKSLAIGGGALEAVLSAPQVRELLETS